MLTELSITKLRNIASLSIEPIPRINLILGDNGSGKTSILEAIHLLALGRSFRSRTLKSLVQFEQKQLHVIAKTNRNIPVGLQFDLNSGLQIRLNNAPLKKLSELAAQLPLQLIPANSHQFFEQGPRYRRQLLDWGLFHVEPNYNFQWQSYRKVLQQRNSAIRQYKKISEIQLWDTHLAQYGEEITRHRQIQLAKLLAQFKEIFPRLCPEFSGSSVTLKNRTGWSKEKTLEQSLALSIERDQQLGYTRSGSHAADWSFLINDHDPTSIFSRGQQKLFFLALCMAQANITEHNNHETSILLLDDISSELDQYHQDLVLNELITLPTQSFITSTDLALSTSPVEHALFHVKQGMISNNNC